MGHVRPQCLVCEAAEGKYKCPQCNLYTCSLTCFREHRDNHPPVQSDTAPIGVNTGSINSANSLEESHDQSHTQESTALPATIADLPEYKTLIQRYPNLERLLWNIAAATDPPDTSGGKSGTLPGSHKGHRKANQPWTKDVGYENGVAVLRRTRDNPGDDRDALREYCELVRIYSAKRDAANAEADFRRQLAREDAKAIGDLIRAEKSEASK
ncbi:uncharacterized protein F4807DRAFT_459492 [Annulohypoxylon truncatum]|uniref:uncharacterized protein n=1 Tax=Annulohypoxylon truncatum TaxID=327061 RepID=UPI0020074A18|nr:uncharacterized protein F4807DRAFT_459492 [Annulohypoxylon truncatum]KAI1210652.1 hypothetical protein F4807DRAFT_459492 [Annulohypoxylon truncatum]